MTNAVYYYTIPAKGPDGTEYKYAPGDWYVTQAKATTKCNPPNSLNRLLWSKPAAGPYPPTSVPAITATALAATFTAGVNSNYAQVVVNVLGGSALLPPAGSYSVGKYGKSAIYNVAISPQLPIGLSLNVTTGIVTANDPVDASGPFIYNNASIAVTGICNSVSPLTPYTISVTDSFGTVKTVTFSLEVSSGGGTPVATPPVLVSKTLASAQVGASYNDSITVQSGTGTAPFTFSKTSGTLPTGVTLNANGTITATTIGSPIGTFTFGATVSDSGGLTSSAVNYSIVITAGSLVATPVINETTLPNGKTTLSYSQSFTVKSGGTAPFTWSVQTGTLPPGLALTGNTLLDDQVRQSRIVDRFLDDLEKSK